MSKDLIINSPSTRENFQKKIHRKQCDKTIQTFVSNLDLQIGQSYKKLNENRKKIILKNKNPKKDPYGNLNNLENKIFSSNQKNESTFIIKSYESPSDNKNISLGQQSRQIYLNNQQLLKYINLVYQIYNIKNPLEDYDNDNINESKQSEYLRTNKKNKFIINFKKDLNSAETLKNQNTKQESQLLPFKLPEEYIARQPNHQIQDKKKDPKINQNIKFSSKTNQIQQIFRFCFMCQAPILQFNLKYHQKTCLPLQSALQKQLDQLINILDEKIDSFKKEINSILITKSQAIILQEINQIKINVKRWMKQLPQVNMTRQLSLDSQVKQCQYNPKWRLQFNNLDQKLKKSSYSVIEPIRKLQWFSKLRQNISQRFFRLK